MLKAKTFLSLFATYPASLAPEKEEHFIFSRIFVAFQFSFELAKYFSPTFKLRFHFTLKLTLLIAPGILSASKIQTKFLRHHKLPEHR